MSDHVECNNCGKESIVSPNTDTCPVCNFNGGLADLLQDCEYASLPSEGDTVYTSEITREFVVFENGSYCTYSKDGEKYNELDNLRDAIWTVNQKN